MNVLIQRMNSLHPSPLPKPVLTNTMLIGYFESLGLPEEEAKQLHKQYYKQYGLSVRGLVRHHHVDPLDYNAACDEALPLESILAPDPALRVLLKSIDTSKVRICALTNAYKSVCALLALTSMRDLCSIGAG